MLRAYVLMDKTFHYWCIESDLDSYLYSIFMPLNLGEEKTINLDLYPELEYANEIHFRWKCLNEGLISLQVLQKMLRKTDFPIELGVGSINRLEWFRITSDLVLYRFNALRDYAYQLANSVLELELKPFNIKLNDFKRKIFATNPKVFSTLQAIESTGRQFREDRNLLAHEGIFSGIKEHIEIMRYYSLIETENTTCRNIIENTVDNDINEFQLNYKTKLKDLSMIFHYLGNEINSLLNNLCDILAVEFKDRYNSKK